MNSKKYTLKPGIHQFAPGSHAVHEDHQLSDEEAEWYLDRYPHIAALFDSGSGVRETKSPAERTDEPEAKISKIPVQPE
jgi:hypothetical protein